MVIPDSELGLNGKVRKLGDIPHRIVKHELMIPTPPIVTNTSIPINDQGFYSELLQSCCQRKATLTGA